MPAPRRIRVILKAAEVVTGEPPTEGGPEHPAGVQMHFRAERARLDVDSIDVFAPMGPDLEIPVVEGIGKVLRVLRAARIAAPGGARDWLDREGEAAALLQRAIGIPLQAVLKPRARLRFVAWTDAGVRTIEDVTEVIETADDYLVVRKRGLPPVRVARSSVVRRLTESERWYEVTEIERA